jgi:hypothetical protein
VGARLASGLSLRPLPGPDEAGQADFHISLTLTGRPRSAVRAARQEMNRTAGDRQHTGLGCRGQVMP